MKKGKIILDAMYGDGFAIPETISWNAYNESSDLNKHVENHYDRLGWYPEAVIADNFCGTHENRKYF